MRRGFKLDSIRLDPRYLGTKYCDYFLQKLTEFLTLTKAITLTDLVHDPRSSQMIALSLSYLIEDQQVINNYVNSTNFYDCTQFEHIADRGVGYHHLEPWYEKTAKGPI